MVSVSRSGSSSLTLSQRATLSRGARESVLSASESQNDIVIGRYKTSHFDALTLRRRSTIAVLLWRKYCCGEGAYVPPLNFFYRHKLLPIYKKTKENRWQSV